MDIDIILEADVTPQQMVELGLEAERLGIRALWSSNYHQWWDGFISLVPVAQATSRLIIGPLAVSPWEMHPLKMANALLTLNELSSGRAMIAVGGGGGVLGAIGWKSGPGAEIWPGRHPEKGTRYPPRRVKGVRECIEILDQARSGKMWYPYEGEVFQTTRPSVMNWASSEGPLVYSCSSGPMMLRMGASVADAVQVSDFTVEMMPHAMEEIETGLKRRQSPADNFRVGNFWAWHIKKDREVALWEARRELIWRGAIIGKVEEEILPFCDGEDELKIIMDNWENFRKACWTRSGNVEGVPEDLVHRLVAGMSSAGDLNDLEQELDRFRQFSKSGLTELSLRLHDDPMDGLKLIGEHVIPAVAH